MKGERSMKNYKQELYEAMMEFRKLKFFKVFPGVTAMEHHTLKAIDVCSEHDENVKISHVVAKMEIPAPGVSRIIRHMEEKGLVERRVDPSDRRNTFVSMTEEGREIFDRCERIIEELGDRVFARMGEDRCEALVQGVRDFVKYTEEEIEKGNY